MRARSRKYFQRFRPKVLIYAAILFVAFPFVLDAENFLHHRLNATILVADADATADLIASWAEEKNGYYLLKSTEIVVIRFPYEHISELRAFLEETAEEVVEMSPQAVDLREELLGLQSGIKSREEILQRNLSYVDDADVDGTLAIEQEVIQILTEIESLKGRLRKLNVDRAYALSEVSLSFMEESIPEDIPSSFGWINTVDFYRFMSRGIYR